MQNIDFALRRGTRVPKNIGKTKGIFSVSSSINEVISYLYALSLFKETFVSSFTFLLNSIWLKILDYKLEYCNFTSEILKIWFLKL